MIIAGPGTGKTATLAHRIVAQAEARGLPPAACLALAFTRRAAAELSGRLARLAAGPPATVTTFHGLGLMILREHSARAGLTEGFGVAGEDERLALAAELTGSPARARRLLKALPGDPPGRAEFASALAARGLVDFDGLVDLPARLLRDDPALAAGLRERWPLVSVDEYQDIDAAQYALLRVLAGDGGGLTVIGDPDQSIYGFRGGDVGFFLRFSRDYPGATTVSLARNYRSAPAIVAGALQAVAPATLVPGRQLRAVTEGGPAKIVVHEAADELAEAAWIAAAIDRLLGGSSFHSLDTGRADGHAGGRVGLADIAVLYRTDAQASALAQALTRAGLPFQKRSHDLLGRRTAVPEVVHEMRKSGPDVGTQPPVAALLAAAVRRVAARAAGPGPSVDALAAGEVLTPLARRCGHDLQGFLTEIALGAEADTLDPRADAVALLTLHAAKGLEFGAVFLAGCERGLLPLWVPGAKDRAAAGDGRVAADVPSGPAAAGPALAEERRLLFVGMTRARTHLFLTCAARRRRHGATRDGGPSPFLHSIDPALLDRSAPPPRLRDRTPAERQLRLL
jgi:superfamily I DNA/RNA helicase